ncbi:MAG: hypothetical protein HS111_40245 [Kofleriaceae bacterium]|nr:hypothetical protein [Kofleriaceae bacterium]MCL4225718.1 hypothetical protein [Myxococcales bacterium]
MSRRVRRARLACALVLVVACAAGAACERPRPPEPVDPSELAIGARVTIRTDTVGADAHARRATFALVDVDNRGERPATVTLGGVLVDGDGHEVGTLRAETLWIPARGRRTFALVDDRDAPRPDAVAVRVDVRGAVRPRHDEVVRIEQGHVWRDGDRVVATGMVRNTADRPCHAVVLAGFHGADGAPLTRPFAVFPIGGGAERPTRFVGPPGSTSGYIFVGKIRC